MKTIKIIIKDNLNRPPSVGGTCLDLKTGTVYSITEVVDPDCNNYEVSVEEKCTSRDTTDAEWNDIEANSYHVVV